MKLPPMPPMPRARKSGTGKPRGKKSKKSGKDIDRVVMWRTDEQGEEGDHTYGTCARCGCRKPATTLTWRPDRIMFGELKQGFWACYPKCD